MADTKRAKEPIKLKGSSTNQEPETNSPSRRLVLRNFFSCKYHKESEEKGKKCKKIKCSGSLCNIKATTPSESLSTTTTTTKRRVSTSGCKAPPPLREINGNNGVVSKSLSSHSSSTLTASSSTSSVGGGSFRVMHLRRLSGCYECHMVVDPINGLVSREVSLRAASICTCPDCGEIFMKAEILEFHQSVRHAVSELGPEDTSRNIVEIIFQSSWLKKHSPVCKIDRILKVHNTKKTISSFENYRDSIKNKASKLAKKHPRCIADGNELLRFHCTSFTCSLGLNGSTNLCDSIPHCKVCSIIRDGIKTDEMGRIQTLATSGRAHDAAQIGKDDEKRAMLVCRVIAGRVRKSEENAVEEFDSVGGSAGIYSNLDELFVFNPRAILPCFVVIYRDF